MELTIAAVACAGSGVICGIPVQQMREDGVTELDLSNRGLGAAAAMLVAYLIPATSVLKNCNLLKNLLDVKSATMLAKIGAEKGIMLSGLTRDQTKAEILFQRLQPTDTILIASGLQFMRMLTTLRLYNNNVGDEGAKAIAEALKFTAVLTFLNLHYNKIGDNGAKAIAEALKVNAVLTNLSLYENRIGDEGAKAIADALRSGTAVLTELWLGANNIGDAGKTAVQDAVKDRSGFKLYL